MHKQSALIVDDEADILELMSITLGRMGLLVQTAASVGEARAKLAAQKFDLCFTDMRLPDGSGLDLLQHISRNIPEMPVAMITAYGNVEAAVQALKAGAFDFVSKPVDLAMLRTLVQTALRLQTERQNAVAGIGDEGKLLGNSDAMKEVRSKIGKLARSQAPVFISGESGVGKELAARAIHEQGPRSAGPFTPVNCGAIPDELMESEFFGHKRGSFTGAVSDKDGLFQAATGGTLFLDEVADLPQHMQVKLLRVIQEKTIRPIGGRAELPVDVRILSATHKDLGKLVEQGLFRQDLYYRINVIELCLPPLRERPGDIGLLVERFLAKLAPEWGLSKPVLSEAALRALQAYDFPGNVRELENVLERAVALCEDEIITPDDLQLRGRAQIGTTSTHAVVNAVTDPGSLGLPNYIDNLEREALMKALEECRWNKTAAAKKLGITFRAMRYRLKKLGIE
jgi:two-component system response regulator PilR (NtrC family)